MKVEVGDVIFIQEGTFKHDKGASGHPAIVIDTNNNYAQVVICTDATHSKRKSASVLISDSSFIKPSMAICNKIGKVPMSNIRNKLGKVSNNVLDDISDKIAELRSYNNIFENWR